MNSPFTVYDHFAKFLTKRQDGFVKQRSVATDMLVILKQNHDALDKKSSSEIIAFYNDFSKAFDKVPHLELPSKQIHQIGFGGSIVGVISDYLDQRKQIVRVDKTSSQLLDVTSGVSQGSVVGPVMFCIFINDLSAALKFSDPHLFADDLKILCIKNNWLKVQSDLDAFDSWVMENQMTLAMDKCFKLTFRGEDSQFLLHGVALKSDKGPRSLRE